MIAWIITVFASALICVISEFLVYGSELNKIIKCILSAFFLLNLLIPLKNFKVPKFDFYTRNTSSKVENKLDNRINNLAKIKIKAKIADFLNKRGINYCQINICMDKNSKFYCKILFEKGVDNRKAILEQLKKNFNMDFYQAN